jgi:hypothetical protein
VRTLHNFLKENEVMTNELSPKVMRHCKICTQYALHYRGRAVCCACFIAKKRELMPPLCELIGPKVFKRKRIRNNYQGAEYHRKWRIRHRQSANEAARRYREKVKSLLPEREKLPKVELVGIEALRHIVGKSGDCEGLSCTICPLNYRETCMNKEILAEAKRLLNEEVIRD